MDPLSYAASFLGGSLMILGLWSVIGRIREGRRYWLPASIAALGAMLFASLHVLSGIVGAVLTTVDDHPAVEAGVSGSSIVALSVTGASIGMLGVAGSMRSRRRKELAAQRDERAKVADEAAWAAERATYDDALQRFLAYDKDLELLLANPMMRDYGDPMIRRVMATMATADGAATAGDHAAYRAAVREFADAVAAAEATARRVRETHFAPGERERIRKAQDMLAHAMDRSTDPAMRREIYAQIVKVLDGVIVIDEEQATQRLALPGGGAG